MSRHTPNIGQLQGLTNRSTTRATEEWTPACAGERINGGRRNFFTHSEERPAGARPEGCETAAPRASSSLTGTVTTSERVFERCERSDRMFRAVLGSTPAATLWRFGPLVILVVAGAAIASVLGWPVR